MPRPGPRPYECIRRAWHSDSHQPLRGALIQEIFRVVNEIHNPNTRKNKEWQEKLPVVVFRAEEILYSKANSESEYADVKTLRTRLDDAVNTMIRREETEEDGVFLAPCIEAALSLGCTPKKIPRGQKTGLSRYLPSSSLKRNHPHHHHHHPHHNNGGVGRLCRSFSSDPSPVDQCHLVHDRNQCPLSSLPHSAAIVPAQFNPPRPAEQSIFFQVPQTSSSQPLPEPGSLVQFLRSADAVCRPICFPRCDLPLSSSPLPSTSCQTHLNLNNHDPRSLHSSNAMCSRMDQIGGVTTTTTMTTAASNAQLLPNISRTFKEVGFAEQGSSNLSFRNMVGRNSVISARNCQPLPPNQETRFNPNLQVFSAATRDVAQYNAPVCSQIAILSHLPSPSYLSSNTSLSARSTMTTTISTSTTSVSARPSSSSLSVVDSVSPLLGQNNNNHAFSHVYDLQLRLGPPGGGESSCSIVNTRPPSCTIQAIMSSKDDSSSVAVQSSAFVEPPPLITTDPDVASSSKRMRFSLKNFDGAPVSMQHSAPYPSILPFAHLRG